MEGKNKEKSIVIFEKYLVRRIWSEKNEKWYFCIVDIIKTLTDSQNEGSYWRKLKERLKKEGNESVTKCHGFKLTAKDGKKRNFDMADVEIVLRIIQSIPSPKAEPFKLWLAKVGYERLKENVDPEISLNRARSNWKTLGRSKKWIEQRMRGQEIRGKLTDYWSEHGIEEEDEFAKLTNIIHKEWSGLGVKEHKRLKELKGHNLQDNMTEAELIFTALAELSTRHVAEKEKAEKFAPNARAAVKGGRYAGKARKDFERLTGDKVVSKENFLPPGRGKADQREIK